MSEKHKKPGQKTLALIMNLRDKFTPAQIAEFLTSDLAKAEGLREYAYGTITSNFSRWDKGQRQGVTQDDVDAVHDLATRLAHQSEPPTPDIPTAIPDNSVIQREPQTQMTPGETDPALADTVILRAALADNTAIHCQTQIAITPDEPTSPPTNTVIQCTTPIDNTDIQRQTEIKTSGIDPMIEVRKMLAEMKVAERPGDTAPGRKSKLQTQLIAARFPVDLIKKLDDLGGRRSHHLEKALMLYLRAMTATESTTE